MSLESIDKLHKDAEKLEKYAELEGNETGELLQHLIALTSGILDCASEEFQEAVAKEISEQLAWFEKNTKIVAREYMSSPQTIEELHYINK